MKNKKQYNKIFHISLSFMSVVTPHVNRRHIFKSLKHCDMLWENVSSNEKEA